jgi:hypothetical protein
MFRYSELARKETPHIPAFYKLLWQAGVRIQRLDTDLEILTRKRTAAFRKACGITVKP